MVNILALRKVWIRLGPNKNKQKISNFRGYQALGYAIAPTQCFSRGERGLPTDQRVAKSGHQQIVLLKWLALCRVTPFLFSA